MIRSLLLPLACFIALCGAAFADFNWPQWRGPNLDGTVATNTAPLTWSETENVLWKTELPWWSGSTPVVWGDRIFLTSPEKLTPENEGEVPKGEGAHKPGGPSLLLLCLDAKDGKLLWTRDLGKGNHLKMKHNMSSPSPVTDGEHVWVITGTGLLRSFDFEGMEIWKRDIQAEYGKFGQMWGYANSPLLYKDRLVLPVLHGWETDEPSYLFAVDKLTGKTIWKTERPTDAIKECPDSYATPSLFRSPAGDQVIMNGGDIVTAHDIMTGKEIWRCGGLNPTHNEWFRIIASTVVAGDWILSPSRRNPFCGIKAGGQGDITTTHLKWTYKMGPDVPTPVSDGKNVWIVDDDGRFSCLDIETGKPVYSPQRIAQGTYDASLVLAGDRIYAINESAVMTVLAATPEFKVLAENKLDDEYTLSTPLICGDRIYIRTSNHLYCIGGKAK